MVLCNLQSMWDLTLNTDSIIFVDAKTALSFLTTGYDFHYATYPNSQQKDHLQSPFENGPEHAESSHPS